MAESDAKGLEALMTEKLSPYEAEAYRKFLDYDRKRADAVKENRECGIFGYAMLAAALGSMAAAYYVGQSGTFGLREAIMGGLKNNYVSAVNSTATTMGIIAGAMAWIEGLAAKQYSKWLAEVESTPAYTSAKAKMGVVQE